MGGFAAKRDGEVELKFSLYEFYFRVANYLVDGYYDQSNAFKTISKPEESFVIEYPDSLVKFLDADEHDMKEMTGGAKIKVNFVSGLD